MKKLMMLALVALLSFGVASVSWAQDGQPTPKAGQKHKAKHKKKGKKSKTPAAAQQQQ